MNVIPSFEKLSAVYDKTHSACVRGGMDPEGLDTHKVACKSVMDAGGVMYLRNGKTKAEGPAEYTTLERWYYGC